MTFVLSGDGRYDDGVGAFRRYQEYLQSKRDVFPPSAFALAASDWYFNPRDHRCPHDAWLESLDISEPSSGKRHEMRELCFNVRLLGAYHDGYIELRYPRVFGYSFNIGDGEHGHGDWLYDELRVSDRGRLIHEVEWSMGPEYQGLGTWLIEASD